MYIIRTVDPDSTAIASYFKTMGLWATVLYRSRYMKQCCAARSQDCQGSIDQISVAPSPRLFVSITNEENLTTSGSYYGLVAQKRRPIYQETIGLHNSDR